MKKFRQYIEEQKEVEIDGYKTKYHYMCPSAVKFFNKHKRMDHSEEEVKALQDVVRLSDDVFEIEAEVEKSGKVSDKQVETAERLVKIKSNIIILPPTTRNVEVKINIW